MTSLLRIVLILFTSGSFLQAADPLPNYELSLVTIQDSGEVIAVIGQTGFSNLDSLKKFISAALPKGTTIVWRASDHPPEGWKKFTDQWKDLEIFCEKEGGKFRRLAAPY